jgi:hypothetical protein
MHRTLLVLAVIPLLANCASSPQWTKPNATQSDLQHDAFECERDAEQQAHSPTNPFAIAARTDHFNKCMEAKGWTQAK